MLLVTVIPPLITTRKILYATLLTLVTFVILTFSCCCFRSSPVTFIHELQDIIVQEGDSAEFFIEISTLKYDVVWKKDGKLLQETERFIIKKNDLKHSLLILNSKIEDSGTYTCNVGGKTSSATHKVEARFIHELQDITVQEGNNASFFIQLSAFTSDVLWKKDGKLLQQTQRLRMENDGLWHSLSIIKSEMEDSGIYTCVVGSKASSASLNVEEVKFLYELQDKIVEEGDAAEFFTKLSASSPGVLWKKDGQLLEGTERFIRNKNGLMHSLLILNSKFEDSGTYTCVVGSQTSSATLIVEAKFIHHLENIRIEEGATAEFFIELSSFRSDVFWEKDGKLLQETERFVIKKKGLRHRLLIFNSKIEDSGTYTCFVGRKISSATLTVKEKIIKESTNPLLQKSTLILGAKVVAGAAVAVGAAAAALPLAGFTATGVAASSVAAAAQSYIGCVGAGSAFAALQSAGVAGMALTTKAVIATGGAAIAALTSIGSNSTET